jgi:hypothetical protein
MSSSVSHVITLGVVPLIPGSAGLSRAADAARTVGDHDCDDRPGHRGQQGNRRETARQFGARGFTVLAGARDEERGREAERVLRSGGAEARFVRLDVTDDASVRQAADWIEREHGRLDALVNAGIARGLYINDPTAWT